MGRHASWRRELHVCFLLRIFCIKKRKKCLRQPRWLTAENHSKATRNHSKATQKHSKSLEIAQNQLKSTQKHSKSLEINSKALKSNSKATQKHNHPQWINCFSVPWHNPRCEAARALGTHDKWLYVFYYEFVVNKIIPKKCGFLNIYTTRQCMGVARLYNKK